MSEDVLFDNFREDVSTRVLEKFRAHGVELSELCALAKLIPAVLPWDKDYDRLRYNVNRRFVFFPMMIVMAKTRKDVVIAFNWAKEKKIHIVPRSGSHCFESYSLTDGIIIDQSRRTGTKISSDRNIAKLEAGCLIGPTSFQLSKVNRAIVGGTCPNTGIAGLSLGGGIGFLVRKYGLASDNLLEITILLANGKLVKANCNDHSDLFWACRGAGNNNYGIVTDFTFRVHPIKRVTIFDFKFPLDQLKRVAHAWFKWAPNTVDDLSAELDIYSTYVQVTGQYLGEKKEAKKLLRPILDLDPESGFIKRVEYIDAVRHFAGEGHWLPFFENKSGFVLRPFPDEALEIIQKFMQGGGPEDHVELDAFGGKVSRISSRATAFPHRKALAWCHLQKHWSLQSQSAEKIEWITRFYKELSPYLHGAYVNAPDRELRCPLEKYYGENLPRLRKIKTKYDPTNIFHYHQSIPPF